MGRKKKEAYKEYVEAEEAAKESEVVTESDELNRHPQSTQEFVQEAWDEPIESDEIATINETIGFTENGEYVVEVSPEQEKSLAEEADDEFMEGITENSSLTPKQKVKKIFNLELDIVKAKARMAEIEDIADLANHKGLETLVEEMQRRCHTAVDDKEMKHLGDGKKIFEAVLISEGAITGLRFEYNNKKADIKAWDREIEELKQGQLSLLEGEQSDEQLVTENNIASANSEINELAEVS